MNKPIFGRALLLAAVFTCFLSPVHAQTVTPDTTANLMFSKDTGTSTSASGVNVTVPSNTGVMGVKFDIVFPSDTFRFDSTSVTVGPLLTTGASGAETYVFIVDRDSENLSPEGKVTIIGVRMQSIYSNKGLNNATFVMLSNLKFQKKNNDTNTALFGDSIYVTNFEFRDQNNVTVASSRSRITLRLLLLLLRRGADFNGDGAANANDLVDFARIFQGFAALGSLPDYGRAGDAGLSYEQRTSDSVLSAEDLIIFARYFQGLEI